MTKITELTKEQEAKIPEYFEKYLKLGFCTDRSDRDLVNKAINRFYKGNDLEAPKEILWFDSPLAAQKAANERNKSTEKPEYFSSFWGHCDLDFIAFYDFIENELPIPEKTVLLESISEISRNAGFWIPFEDVVFISERPIKNVFDFERKILHCETGPSVEFADGFKVFSLNGIRVPAWLVETPIDEIDPEKVMAISNVEIRLQAIKFVGLDKLYNKLNAQSLDVGKGDLEGYELVTLDILDRKCEFLKMINPSTGEIHVEGVKPGIKTVTEALAFRNSKTVFEKPRILT